MALSLMCPCGADFEVEDTFAGQTLSCPDCGAPRQAPPLRTTARRTSGYALASMVLALVGAFTLVGTVVAVLLGVMGLVSIRQRRGEVAGTGFALTGIVLGVILTLLTSFAVFNGEIFEHVREGLNSQGVDRSGPLEIVRKDEGYVITRASRQWGVASAEQAQEMGAGENLVLINPGRDAYLEVVVEDVGRQTLQLYREQFLDIYRKPQDAPQKKKKLEDLATFTEFTLRESRSLPEDQGLERLEVIFDVRLMGQRLTYRARFFKARKGETAYVVVGWAHRRRQNQVGPEILKMQDSFRVLDD